MDRTETQVRRGEVYWYDNGEDAKGSVQIGRRPVAIIQNDVGNKFSPTTIVAFITSKTHKNFNATHVPVEVIQPSTILCEQIKTINKSDLMDKIGVLPNVVIEQMNEKLKISLGLV